MRDRVLWFICCSVIFSRAATADDPIRIALIGDSTVASYRVKESEEPQMAGWGQVFSEFFRENVDVKNHAAGGRSSKSFLKEGRWERVLAEKPDFIFIQFGHNDCPAKGERTTNPNGDYRDYLRKYIADAREMGAVPVLVTPVARRTFADGKITSTLTPYVEAMLAVGNEEKVPVIDLNKSSTALFEQLGDEESADLNCCKPTDRTHFSFKGARAIAGLVADEIPEQVSELKAHLASPKAQVNDWQAKVDALVESVSTAKRRPAIVVGILPAGGPPQYFSYGRIPSEEVVPNERTLFQIGSVTKVFTGLLLAEAIERGEVQLDDPVSKHLPEIYPPIQRGDRKITLKELATHRSGLGRLPPGMQMGLFVGMVSQNDPYRHCTDDYLSKSATDLNLKDEETPSFSYSNFGVGLLGRALARRAGMDYESLIRERIARPLKLSDTVLVPTKEQAARIVHGHDGLTGQEVPCWKFAELSGCGGLYSTAEDLMKFLAAQLAPDETDMGRAISLSHQLQSELHPKAAIGMCWMIRDRPDQRTWWHNGSTAGHSSFIAFAKDPPVAVVVLVDQGVSLGLTGMKSVPDPIGIGLFSELLKK